MSAPRKWYGWAHVFKNPAIYPMVRFNREALARGASGQEQLIRVEVREILPAKRRKRRKQ